MIRFITSARILKVLAVYGLVVTIAVTVFVWPNPIERAVVGMAWGLILLWIVLGGTLARVYRDNVRRFVTRVPMDRGARRPRPWHYILAVFLPFLFAIPVAAVVGYLHPVKIHFPQ